VICWASVLECGVVPSPGTLALPGQPKADSVEDKQGMRRDARGEERRQQREGEEEIRTCWGREEQEAVKAAGRQGGIILHDLDTPNSTDYAGSLTLAPMWLQAPRDECVEAQLCCAHS